MDYLAKMQECLPTEGPVKQLQRGFYGMSTYTVMLLFDSIYACSRASHT